VGPYRRGNAVEHLKVNELSICRPVLNILRIPNEFLATYSVAQIENGGRLVS
jgi:hypothetical protein